MIIQHHGSVHELSTFGTLEYQEQCERDTVILLEQTMTLKDSTDTYDEAYLLRAEKHRERAKELAHKKKEAARAARAARRARDFPRAKELNDLADRHKRQMDMENRDAASAFIRATNSHREENEVDLHYLYKAEALRHLREKIPALIARGHVTMRVITGRGVHSAQNENRSVLRPAVEDWCSKAGIQSRTYAGGGALLLDLPDRWPPEGAGVSLRDVLGSLVDLRHGEAAAIPVVTRPPQPPSVLGLLPEEHPSEKCLTPGNVLRGVASGLCVVAAGLTLWFILKVVLGL